MRFAYKTGFSFYKYASRLQNGILVLQICISLTKCGFSFYKRDSRLAIHPSLRKEIAYVQKQYDFTDAEIQKMQEYAKEALFLHL